MRSERGGKFLSSLDETPKTKTEHRGERSGIEAAQNGLVGKSCGETEGQGDEPGYGGDDKEEAKHFFHTQLGSFVCPTFVFIFYGLSSQYEKVRLVFEGLDPRAKKERPRS